jgi:hypothetical protein
MSKIIELVLKVEGAETLNEMAEASRELEQELRAAGKGAEDFAAGMSTLSASRAELNDFRTIIRGMDFTDQIAGATRFVNGIVGGFSLMKTAALAFGEEGSESMEKVITTLGTMMTAMTSLSAIAKAFDDKTMASLKMLGGQFKNLVGVVKTGSLAMKAALIGTGIGAIAVILGVIIANWQKIIDFSKIALGIEKDRVKEAEKNLAYNEALLKAEESRSKIIMEIVKLTGDEGKALAENYRLSKINYDIAVDRLDIATAQLNTDKRNAENIGGMRMLWASMLQQVGLYGKSTDVILNKAIQNVQNLKVAEVERLAAQEALVLAMQKESIAQEQIYALWYKTGASIEESAFFAQKIRNASEDYVTYLKNQNDELGIYKENEAQIAQNKSNALQEEIVIRSKIANYLLDNLNLDKNRVDVARDSIKVYDEMLFNDDKQLDTKKKMDAFDRQKIEHLNNELKATVASYDQDIFRLRAMNLQIAALQHQQKIIIDTEKERVKQQKIDDYKYNRELSLNKLLADQAITVEKVKLYMAEQQQALEALYNVTQLQTEELGKQEQVIGIINTGFEDYINTYDELNNVSDRYNGKLQEFLSTTVEIGGGIRVTADAYNELIGLQAISNEDLELSVNYYTSLLELQNQKVGKHDEDIIRAGQELALLNTMSDVMLKQLETTQTTLLTQKQGQQEVLSALYAQATLSRKALENKEAELLSEQNYVEELAKRGVKGRELQKETDASLLRQKKLEQDILQAKQNVVDADNNVLNAEREIANTDKQVLQVNVDINKELDKRDAKSKKITNNLKNELKATEKIADWWKENAELAQGAVDVMNAGMELIGVGFQNNITTLNQAYQQLMLDSQANIDQLKLELDALNDDYEDQSDNLDELMAMREDADGERLAAIDAEIASIQNKSAVETQAIKDKENQIIRAENQKKLDEVKYNNQRAQAEHKNAQWQKATNIIGAISNGVLAVLKSAPNVVMMAISGVLAAASVATIAAQKIPQPLVYPAPVLTPEIKAKGGMIVGDSHSAPSGGVPILAEGGEWIAPRWMMSNPQTAPMIQNLESIRRGRYAEGGTVKDMQPMLVDVQKNAGIDYDLLAASMSKLNIWTSVAEIRDVDRQYVKVVYEGSSI